MANITLDKLNEWSKLGHRNTFGDSMTLLAADRPKVCAVVPDVTNTVRMIEFEKEYPNRLFNVGIAEQNMIGFTAGLAREGLIPFAVSLGAFAPMRCAEQMRMALGYMNLNAKVVSLEAGCGFGPLGNTHYAMDDIAVARAIPNFTVICPSDPHQIYKALCAAADYTGPVFIRLTGAAGFPVLYPDNFDFKIGKAIEYRKGSDVAIISTGAMLAEAVKAADILEKKGISARVIDMHTVKPIDTQMLDSVFSENKLIVSVEEHTCIGGLGSAIAEYKATKENTPKQVFCSLRDSFMKVGDRNYQLESNGLTAEHIAQKVVDNL
jgi:transketolase